MTNFEKIKNYYKHFDEKNRLKNDYSGQLDFLMTMGVLEKYLPDCAVSEIKILDLGGGAGAYSIPLAKRGYKVTLADLSEALVTQAKNQKEENQIENLVACDIVNATDLSCYSEESFDVVLLFGPLYHLTEKEEREICLAEVHRVLKFKGKIFASFIPHLSGSIALVSRFCWSPDQVSIETLNEAFNSGRFNNLSDKGFQEGYYPTSEEVENLFSEHGFEKLLLRSLRGFGYEKEEMIYKFKKRGDFEKIIELINSTAENKSIIETCGHAIYVGVKGGEK